MSGRASMVWDILWRAFTASLADLNFLYYSMGFICLTALVLASIALRKAGKLDPDSRVAQHVERMRTAFPAVIVLSLVTLVAGMESGIERAVQAWHGLDFTPQVWAIEGNLTERFQDWARSPFLDYLLVATYTAGSFLFYFIPFFVLVALGRGKNAMRVAFTMMNIWIVGFVFYLFFPVNEVWMTATDPYNYTHVRNILFDYTDAENSDAYARAVNNNFPSLHVALTVGIATALWLAREKWLAIPGTILASCVVVATVYLGIHWFVDVVAGLALAFGAAWIAHRRTAPEPVVGMPRWLRFWRRTDEPLPQPAD